MKITYPFVIISDVHCHDWSAFSYIMEDGTNSRLHDTLQAIADAVLALKKAGGNDLVITGDLFHTRGKLKPSVLNPVYILFKEIASTGVRVFYIPGNHDLEFRESNELGDAAFVFDSLDGWTSFRDPTIIQNAVFLPWIEEKDDFLGTLEGICPSLEDSISKMLLFCHIGIDGVLDGVKGKIGTEVLKKGFKNVFAGDYHNHKNLGNGIYSVGALCHHNFGDCGSTAGYLLVYEDRVEQHETSAPKFMDYYESCDPSFYTNNYVRIKGEYTEEEAKAIREVVATYNGKSIDQSTRPSILVEAAATKVKVEVNLEASIESYVETFDPDLQADILVETKKVFECLK